MYFYLLFINVVHMSKMMQNIYEAIEDMHRGAECRENSGSPSDRLRKHRRG